MFNVQKVSTCDKVKSELVYSYKNNEFIFDDSFVVIDLDTQKLVTENWCNLLEAGKKYDNGIILTIDSVTNIDSYQKFTVKKTKFDYYLYSKNHCQETIAKCRSIASNILLITSDDYFVLGRMSNETSLSRIIKFIGGAVSLDDIQDNKIDFDQCISREFKEEIGLDLHSEYFYNVQPTYIVTRKGVSFYNVLFTCQTKYDRSQLNRFFENYKKNLILSGEVCELK